jgi:DNA/RNA-binding domain of Phe-tRNA-synthetase-like protein
MTFIVAEDCTRLGLRAGAIVFRNVHVAAADPGSRAEITSEVERLRSRFPDPVTARGLPEVVSFQEILRKVRVNPRREQPSVERLLLSAIKRGNLPAINTLVDAYNLVSVLSFCSLGAHDLDRIDLPVSLRLLTGQESFKPLGCATEEVVTAGEYGYVDGRDRVLCRLDLRQAEFSKVTTSTRNVLLIVEGTTTHRPEVLRQTMTEVIERVTRHCGGTAEVIAWPDLLV